MQGLCSFEIQPTSSKGLRAEYHIMEIEYSEAK